MLHVSTRGGGEAPALGFSDALLAGLARDGGLYVPASWPSLSPEAIGAFAGKPYGDVAKAVLGPLVGGDIPDADLGRMIDEAYATFGAATCPLAQLGDNLFVLELFHGPTLAFKDVAMRLLGRLMDHVLKARGARATIVGATSGDTWPRRSRLSKAWSRSTSSSSTPMAAFRRPAPADDHGRLAERPRARGRGHLRRLPVHGEGHVQPCPSRDELQLSGVNSINWARVAAQAVYYFTAAVSLGAPHRPVSFSVPTGNFGDILAGWVAKRMGLPIERLMIGTNANDILARTLRSGAYEIKGVQPTASPSMDIQISSNFERLLFEAYGRDAGAIRRLMANLAQSKAFLVDTGPLRASAANSRPKPWTRRRWRTRWRKPSGDGYVLDPHTAVGTRAARARSCESGPGSRSWHCRPRIPPSSLTRSSAQPASARSPAPADLMERKEASRFCPTTRPPSNASSANAPGRSKAWPHEPSLRPREADRHHPARQRPDHRHRADAGDRHRGWACGSGRLASRDGP